MRAMPRAPLLALYLAAPFLAVAQNSPSNLATQEFFEKNIRPIFATRCQDCHNARVKTAGLDLSSPEGFTRGGQSGPLISSSDPASSSLLKVVSYEERLKMPPTGKLSDAEIAALREWVSAGAGWPGAPAAATAVAPKRTQS